MRLLTWWVYYTIGAATFCSHLISHTVIKAVLTAIASFSMPFLVKTWLVIYRCICFLLLCPVCHHFAPMA